jgi:hypothetical protein
MFISMANQWRKVDMLFAHLSTISGCAGSSCVG